MGRGKEVIFKYDVISTKRKKKLKLKAVSGQKTYLPKKGKIDNNHENLCF